MAENSGTIKILFRALLTMKGETVEDGELVLEGARIKEISSVRTEGETDETIDLSDFFLLPGFVNAHCHLALSALHGRVPPREKFTDWARDLVSMNSGLSLEERVKGLSGASNALIRSGVTTLGDYLAEPELLAEYSSLPFRKIVFLEVLGFKNELAENLSRSVEEAVSGFGSGDGLLKLGIAPHAPYTVSPALFKKLRELSDRRQLPFSCHVAEFPEEVRFLEDGGGEMYELHQHLGSYDSAWEPPGVSPLRYLDSLDVLNSMIAVHLNYIDGDLDLLRSRKAGAVFCPGSTRWFGRKQWMPVRELLDRGVEVGLGTDSLASNDSLNFLHELKIAEEMLPDVRRVELLEMATRGGAAVLGIETGVVAPGSPADLIGFRIEKTPAVWEDVIFEPDREEADFVMLNGEQLAISN